MAARFRIVGTNLPGRTCGPSKDRPEGYADVHVGVQRGREIEGLVPGDARAAEWAFEVGIRNGRFGGPYVHGRNGERFVYLSWVSSVDGHFVMFRRAKLHLPDLDPEWCDGRSVTGTLSLTDGRGHPLCASVRTPAIGWSVE